jgi:WD40 repeat protein
MQELLRLDLLNDGGDVFIYNAHRPRSINAMSWSPGGEYLASASNDGTVHVWHVI